MLSPLSEDSLWGPSQGGLVLRGGEGRAEGGALRSQGLVVGGHLPDPGLTFPRAIAPTMGNPWRLLCIHHRGWSWGPGTSPKT